jgi:peptidoglycan hydrolase-like protein with peptidoglycan-binding domain
MREEQAMRVLILAVSVLGILISADAAKAGLSTTTRNLSASVEPAAFADEGTQKPDEGTQKTEDQIGLDKGKRRDVQRGLTGLGFDTKVNGKFDESTRAVITRWQEARGYPNTGFLNTLQHKALMTEVASAAQSSSSEKPENDHPASRRGGDGAHHGRNGGGPGGLIGGVMGGLFGHR